MRCRVGFYVRQNKSNRINIAKDFKMTDTNEIAKDKRCGIIMPISSHPDYSQDHWKDVLSIISEAINETQFKPNLVSDDEAIGLIHERIVTNIYNNEMVVCDVSSKNPNVMFELGLRLAFDKPVIIIKDDKTSYTFDTGVIEHISYPSSLRFGDIVSFKKDLTRRIEATYKKAIETTNYSPFLKGFGKKIVPAKIQGEEVSETKFLIDQIYGLKDEMKRLRYDLRNNDSQLNLASLNDLSNSYRSLLSRYFRELMNKKTTKVISRTDLLEYAKEKSKENMPGLNYDQIEKLVEVFWSDVIGGK
jgi:hypothetical protein